MTWFGSYKRLPEETCSSLPMVTGHWRAAPGKSWNWSHEIRQQISTSVCCQHNKIVPI